MNEIYQTILRLVRPAVKQVKDDFVFLTPVMAIETKPESITLACGYLDRHIEITWKRRT